MKENQNKNPKEELFKTVHTQIGLTLVMLQVMEAHLKRIIHKVDPQDKNKYSSRLFENPYERRTLGQLIKLIRNRYSLNSDFIDHLLDVLERRNKFVHNLIHQEFYSTDNPKKLFNTNKWVSSLRKDSRILANKFYEVFTDINFDRNVSSIDIKIHSAFGEEE